MITKKQHELLLYLNSYIKQNGISPSFEEMKIALNLHSKSGIHRLITSLQERGFVRRLANRARAIEIIRLPEDIQENEDNQAQNEKQKRIYDVSADSGNAINIPLYGKIAAGTPIEALRDNEATLSVPKDMLGIGEHYALKVAGDSMEEAGILDGDTVIIKRTNTANDGTIVVALVDGFEVTLKTLRRRGAAIILEPANHRYEPRTFNPDRILIQGVLVGLMRNYNA